MGRRKEKGIAKSHTLPSSPTHSFSSSSSSSDFEFTISLSPRKSSAANLCPADELFYKGQLLPLHLSPRISMVRTLLLASSSTSSSDTTTTASRDSTGSSNDSHSSFSSDLLHHHPECDSSRPSSATEDDEYKRLTNPNYNHHYYSSSQTTAKKSKYFSLSRFSSVFRRDYSKTQNSADSSNANTSPVKRMSTNAKEVIRKYLKKVKPLYEKLSQNQKQNPKNTLASRMACSTNVTLCMKAEQSNNLHINTRKDSEYNKETISHSFSGNLRYPRRKRRVVSSCPSSMRSSPSHSGVLSSKNYYGFGSSTSKNVGNNSYADASSMEELQSAIQGAIAHCKNSMMQNNSNNNIINTTNNNKTMVSNEI